MKSRCFRSRAYVAVRALCVAGVLAGRALAASPQESLDAYLAAEMSRRHIPGLAVAVVKDGKPVLLKGYGLSNLELSTPATADTVFRLGSITKQFTATAIMMLADEGKLSPDDLLSKHLPDVPPAWKAITLRQLLNHVSGIHNFTELPNAMRNIRLDVTHDQRLGAVRDRPLDFKPGEKFHYSNTNYFILGMVVEKVSGESYSQFLNQRLFQPLGMTATRLYDYRAITPNRAAGYTSQGGRLENADYMSPSQPFAAGAMESTATDMGKWLAALDTHPESILKPASWEQMYTPGQLNDGGHTKYGFGWTVSTMAGRRALAHGGLVPGFNAFINRLPDDHLSLAILTNSAPPPSAGELALKVAGIYLGQTGNEPVKDGEAP